MLTIGLFGIADVESGAQPSLVHDHGIAVMKDGRVLTVVELERWTGRKHDNRMPEFVGEILDGLALPDEEVRFVSCNHFVGDTFLSRDGRLRIEPERRPDVASILTPARAVWYPDGRRRRPCEAWVIAHEFAHIACGLPFWGAFGENDLLVHIDGGASRSSASFWVVREGKPVLLQADWHSLKDATNLFNASPLSQLLLGMGPEDHLAMPGKLMGYAGWGRNDESLRRRLAELRGFLEFAGDRDQLWREALASGGFPMQAFDPRSPAALALGAALQGMFQEQVVGMISRFARRTGSRVLRYSGGGALNIVANAALEQLDCFDAVHVPPAPSDAGLALGAAAWLEYLDRGRLARCDPFLATFGDLPGEPLPAPEELARRLADGRVIGFASGAAEFGPRALGHRSILARADDVALRRRVSEQIKGREWYRPVAPMMLRDEVERHFGPRVAASPLSRLMLGAYPVPPALQASLQGATHADGTVRLQVVEPGASGLDYLAQVLEAARRDHGMTGILNTSLNARGSPLAHSRSDLAALRPRLAVDEWVGC